MAEYIDREAIIAEIQKNINTYWNEGSGGYYLAEDALNYSVKTAPTADVAPKSEVEKEIKNWQELYADTVSKWEKAYEELEIKLENAKTDVARDIFEEIDYLIKRYTRKRDGLNAGMFGYELAAYLPELKKKYEDSENG